MTHLTRKSFDSPDEVRDFPGVKAALVDLGGIKAWRLIADPGWRWSESIGPTTKKDICPWNHVFWMVLKGRFAVQMEDGTTEEFGPGDVGRVPPGHDAWVVGDEPVVGIDIRADGIDKDAIL